MFLPDDYKTPSNGGAGNYVRFRFNAKPQRPIDPERAVKHFWAMLVWDYEDGAIKIWEITQKKIQGSLQELSRSQDWGAPFFYDIKVMRSGKELETSYTVLPCPSRALHPSVEEEYQKKPCWLEALFDGEDPWNTALHRQFTRGVFTQGDLQKRGSEKERELLEQLVEAAEEMHMEVDRKALAMYVGLKAAEKRRSFSEVVQSALIKDFTGSFLSAYKQWHHKEYDRSAVEVEAEAIPF
jgi:hypothetical protein